MVEQKTKSDSTYEYLENHLKRLKGSIQKKQYQKVVAHTEEHIDMLTKMLNKLRSERQSSVGESQSSHSEKYQALFNVLHNVVISAPLPSFDEF